MGDRISVPTKCWTNALEDSSVPASTPDPLAKWKWLIGGLNDPGLSLGAKHKTVATAHPSHRTRRSRVLEWLVKLVPQVSFVPPLFEYVLDANLAAVPEERVSLVAKMVEEESEEKPLVRHSSGEGKGPSIQVMEEVPRVFLESVNQEDAELRASSAEVVDSSQGGGTPASPNFSLEDVLGQMLTLPPSPGCCFGKKM
ncbi:hypothetical protein ACOSP7_006750 [Xanthoceras sorbifolium]